MVEKVGHGYRCDAASGKVSRQRLIAGEIFIAADKKADSAGKGRFVIPCWP